MQFPVCCSNGTDELQLSNTIFMYYFITLNSGWLEFLASNLLISSTSTTFKELILLASCAWASSILLRSNSVQAWLSVSAAFSRLCLKCGCCCEKASWYSVNRAWRVITWALSPLLTWLPSMICVMVADPYRPGSIQHRSIPLLSMYDPIALSCAITM